jgi:hypothetical protein
MPEFINELTGEVTAPADYIAHLRILERTIVRLDDTIAGLQSNLKQAKQGRDAAVSDLRAAVREIKILAPSHRRRPKAKRR